MRLELTEPESEWRADLERRLSQFRIDAGHADRIKELNEMRDLAIRLHRSLSDRNYAPVHHRYMIQNRGVQPDDHEFYFHLHPIQDLIKFTYDTHANDDPVDATIGAEFSFTVSSRRWGHEDSYSITRTASGWYLRGLSHSGPCDKTGHPFVAAFLRQDSIQYPHDVGEWFEWLWQQARDSGLSAEEVQNGLNDIARWISVTESSTPDDGIWEGLA